ncbi:tetratricopeptide repeat protein [Sulfuricurvum sp.]|uniref:tetratricopeptide repeat protein n=1 Tax=Sulfuricurvum sp. TaxID=2025608 RepID=UPI003BAECC56
MDKSNSLDIVLDLDHTDTQIVENTKLLGLQQEAYKEVIELLVERREKINDQSKLKNIYDCRTRNTIMINGGRGTGKTFFVLNIKKYLEYFGSDDKEKKILDGLYFFKTIDPTLLHDSENFLTIILAKILNEIELKECDDKVGEDDKKQFYKKLSAVADSIDGICGMDGCKRSAFEIISQDQSSLKLEQNLHEFFGLVCMLLKKKQLVLAIDDIDMAFDKGYEVLEVVRKYLNSPYIIPIITGDIQLYEMIIQKKFADKLTLTNRRLDPYLKDNNIKEDEQEDNNIDSINKSELSRKISVDYLGKLFEQKSRVHLKSLKDLKPTTKRKVKLKDCKNEMSLLRYESRLRKATNDDVQDKVFEEFSLRTFLSFAKETLSILNVKKDSDDETKYIREIQQKLFDLSEKYRLGFEKALFYFKKANELVLRGKHDSAIKYYEKATQSNPKYSDAYAHMGIAYYHNGDLDQAIEALIKAIELNPHDDDFNYQLGRVYIAKEEYPQAIESYLKAIEINPKNGRYYMNLGYAYAALDENKKAVLAYEKGIELNPEIGIAYNNLGVAYKNVGKIEEAIKSYKKAIDLDPALDLPYINLYEIQILKNEKLNPALIESFKTNVLSSSWLLVFDMFEILANRLDDENLDDILNTWNSSHGVYPKDWDFDDLDKWATNHPESAKIQKCLDVFKSHKRR